MKAFASRAAGGRQHDANASAQKKYPWLMYCWSLTFSEESPGNLSCGLDKNGLTSSKTVAPRYGSTHANRDLLGHPSIWPHVELAVAHPYIRSARLSPRTQDWPSAAACNLRCDNVPSARQKTCPFGCIAETHALESMLSRVNKGGSPASI